MKRTIAIVAAAAAAMLSGAPAAAQNGAIEFLGCDGFGAPTRGGDAMTRGADGIAFFSNARNSAQLRRRVPVLGSGGIGYCTAALADPRLEPAHNLRRASLIHARAMHRLAANDVAAAIEDLALAERSAAGGDVLFERSFGLALRLARAYAMIQSGDANAAARISSGIIADRPYDPGVTFAAARLHFIATRDWGGYVARVRGIAAVDPSLIASLFTLSIFRGEYDEAIRLHPQIVMSLPRARGAYQIEGIHDRAAEQVALRAWVDGALAHAHQARGDDAAADAAFAAARANLELALAPPVRADGSRPGRQQRQRHRAVQKRSDDALEGLAVWERHVRLRRLVAAGQVDEVIADLERAPITPDTATVALFEQMIRARPELRDSFGAEIGPLRQRIYAEIEQLMTFSHGDLAQRLPEPESRARLPVYEPQSGAFRIRANDDYRTRSGSLEGVMTVRFFSPRGSLATAHELALLRAADLARENGKSGLIVIDRRSVIQTLTTQGVMGVHMELPTGQQVELDVLFVDPDNLPPDYAEARWRVLAPDAIRSALGPVYAPPPPAAPAS